ncbi:hypothetical protein LOTGIDRAFT_157114 [Lottia gigantea]|uniref:Apple domain-containing protein n=1 Tax=Lottia gigantea TaxID=225164 RepID=V4ADA5_LOTGI|nr:hypothetical protein LOTGIDRAFT_157114 [Lottia gigantea]ESP01979.1 hypothetical protein LOTGIDRAFT_157114 [Lottia gigantea]
MWQYFLFLVIGCKMTDAMNKPKYLWPLSGLSNDLEVMTDQNNSSLSDCFPTGPGHPDLNYTSLYFDGTQYLDVRIPSDPNITDSDIAFTLFFKTETNKGVLFHYEADYQTTVQGILTMHAEVIAGNVTATMKVTENCSLTSICGSPNSVLNVTLNSWTMVVLVYNFNDSRLSLYVNNKTQIISINHLKSCSLITPGRLTFGGSKYIGSMTGAALYNSDSGFDEQDLLKNALKSNWSWNPPDPPCFLSSHVWTMDNKGFTKDMKTFKKNEHKCLRFGDEHPNLPNNAILMDGSSLSVLRLEINGEELDSNFTLVINIYVQKPTSGSLLNITDRYEQKLFDLSIGENFIVLRAFLINGTECGFISTANMFNTSTWYLVGIRRDISNGTMAIVINNDIINSAFDSCGMFNQSGMSFVEIGSWDTNTPGYRGFIRCLVMFSIVDSNIIFSNHDTCLNEADNVSSDLKNKCTMQLPRRRKYDLLKSDMIISSSLAPLAVYDSTPQVKCAYYCFRHRYCRSFTFFNNRCSMYDLVTLAGLAEAPGATYYAI